MDMFKILKRPLHVPGTVYIRRICHWSQNSDKEEIVRVCLFVCVCVRERERERDKQRQSDRQRSEI